MAAPTNSGESDTASEFIDIYLNLSPSPSSNSTASYQGSDRSMENKPQNQQQHEDIVVDQPSYLAGNSMNMQDTGISQRGESDVATEDFDMTFYTSLSPLRNPTNTIYSTNTIYMNILEQSNTGISQSGESDVATEDFDMTFYMNWSPLRYPTNTIDMNTMEQSNTRIPQRCTLDNPFEDLQQYFGMKRADVVINVGISLSTLKRFHHHRHHGINRLPYSRKKTPAVVDQEAIPQSNFDTLPSDQALTATFDANNVVEDFWLLMSLPTAANDLEGTDGQHSEGQHHVNGAEASHHEADQMVESVPHQEESDPQVFEANDCPQEREPMLSDTLTENDAMNGHDNMEIGDANGTVNGQDLGRDGSSATNSQSSTHALPTSGFEISNPSDCLELTRQEQQDEDFDNDKVEAAGVEGTEEGKIAEAQLNSKGSGKQKAKEKISRGEKGSRTHGRERSNNKTRRVRIPIPLEDTLQTKKMRLVDAANNFAQQEQLDEDSDNDKVEPEEGEIAKTRGVRIVIPLENILKIKEMQRKDAANHLGVSISTLKRICREYGILRWPPRDVDKLNNQSHLNEPPAVIDDRERIPQLNSDVLPCNQVSTIDTNRVTVMAKYKGSRIKFQLSLPWRKVELEQEVKKRLPLEAGTYFINYKDVDGEMTLIACDEDLEGYISSSSPLSTRLIELFLEPM